MHSFYGPKGEPHHKPIFEIPEKQIRMEIQKHLVGSFVNSHFSSWAADFQTALTFAGVGHNAHIAVFDTSLRGEHNVVYHVPALNAMLLTSIFYDHENLVYGPVAGRAYTCVSATRLRKHGMTMTLSDFKGTPQISAKNLEHASKIANLFKPNNDGLGRDLFLTLFAVELTRLLRPHTLAGWSEEDKNAILRHLCVTTERAAKFPHNESLVNPKTYTNGFPELRAMIDLLTTIELEIDRKRSKFLERLEPATSLSPAPGRKRKADDVHGTPPQDLLQDLVKHSRTLQDKLRAAQKQFHSMHSLDRQALALMNMLAATEKELRSFIL